MSHWKRLNTCQLMGKGGFIPRFALWAQLVLYLVNHYIYDNP